MLFRIEEIKEILEKYFDKKYWDKTSITISCFLEILEESENNGWY